MSDAKMSPENFSNAIVPGPGNFLLEIVFFLNLWSIFSSNYIFTTILNSVFLVL